MGQLTARKLLVVDWPSSSIAGRMLLYYLLAFNYPYMIKAKRDDKRLVTELLISSFADNPSVDYIISANGSRRKRMAVLMNYSFNLCMRFGEVWLSDDRNGCALILFPQRKRTTICGIWQDLVLLFGAVGWKGLKKVLRRERLVNKMRPKTPMGYIWFIGVDPLCQQSGIGSTLLSQVIARCNELKLPVYLETSVLRNLPWYNRFGFMRYDQLNLGYQLHFLVRSV